MNEQTVTSILIDDIQSMMMQCETSQVKAIGLELFKAIGPGGSMPVQYQLALLPINELDALHDKVLAIYKTK